MMARDWPSLFMALRIAVLGRGAWGQALITLWQQQGHQLRSWSRGDASDPAQVLSDADLVVSAVAMVGIQGLAEQLSDHWPHAVPLLSCSKGLDPDRLMTASQLWSERISTPLAVLSGPNLAHEIQSGLPATSVVSSHCPALSSRLQRSLGSDKFRLYSNDDPLGTEVAAALKNVMAVAAGLCDGLQQGNNARAALLTRGLAEMGIVQQWLGGRPQTLFGLAGLGDLLATATSPLSRNYRCGLLLAAGMDVHQAIETIGATVEGPRTARAALKLAAQRHGALPICEQVVAVCEARTTAAQAALSLMQRDLRAETLSEQQA